MEQIVADYIWLLTRWWFWIGIIVGMILGWYLFKQRTYKEDDRILFVRHGRLGKWIDVEEHLRIKHPIEWAMLQKEKNKK